MPVSCFGCIRVFAVRMIVLRMSSSILTYEDAVQKLNLLQSNKATISQIRKEIKNGQKCTNIEDMQGYLLRTGVTMAKLDELSVIHVAGTKGKGSTSAMCESILRLHGFRTGFFSSPHLVAVRERIRINGQMLTKNQFAEYFHEVYDALDKSKVYNSSENKVVDGIMKIKYPIIKKTYEGDMPKYFSFLTVLAFNVFIKEKVDVAIVEVGIGGTFDYTNVLRKVPVVGITALGLDHTSILGNTLPEIAAAKAGIMKENCQAYTVEQPPEAMAVLQSTAENVKCSLTIVPDYDTYTYRNGSKLTIGLESYKMNASLAIQLSHAWMRLVGKDLKAQANGSVNNTDTDKSEGILVNNLCKATLIGLKECKWPGRYQIIMSKHGLFYLDGAHTPESMAICAMWFEAKNRNHRKCLIFSATGDRDAEVLLKHLAGIPFEEVYFVIPTAYKEVTKNNDNYSLMEKKELMLRCENHALVWQELNNESHISIDECVSDVIMKINENPNVSTLVTGSLHLVGAALSIIYPNLGEDDS